MSNIVGKRIKELRKQRNMSVDQLAEKVGKSRATIYRYENGEIEKAPYTVLVPFAEALGTTPTYLMGIDTEQGEEKYEGASLAEKVGARIHVIRYKRGMSVEELAEKTGITPQKVIDMENGVNRGFDTNLMLKFCKALNVDKSYFVDIAEPVDNIGANIKALRELQELSAYEVANELNLDIDDYEQIENQDIIPFDLLDKVARIFGINVATLIGMDFRVKDTKTKTAMRIIKTNQRWLEEVGETSFTDEEMDELINFAKYLLSKRKAE